MVKLDLRTQLFFSVLAVFLALGIVPCGAQSLSIGIIPDSGVLVSQARVSSELFEVNLETSLVDIKAVEGSSERYGQGIILDSNGIIATNRHIIGEAKQIYVVLAGGRMFEAHLLSNSQADLCLIKIDAPFPLRAVSLADASEIRTGKHIIAIANAGFNPQRKKEGQIIHVFNETSPTRVDILQMDIPLNPGDSGGPILNEQGALVGLIMGKQKSNPTHSYAIASNLIQQEYFKYRNIVLN